MNDALELEVKTEGRHDQQSSGPKNRVPVYSLVKSVRSEERIGCLVC